MASTASDAHAQPPKRPGMHRQSSTSSQVSQSPSEGHHKAAHRPQRQHVVGQGRMQRNTSTGKNLNKLSKLSQAQQSHTQQHHQQAEGSTTKHHRRHNSGSNANSAPSSPRPSFRRNASSGGIVRAAHQSHAHPAIRKNHSSGHLARQGSSKNVLKATKSEVAPPRRSLAHPGKARQQSPDAHPTVHFDVGDNDDDGPDDGWTEESASQSPTTTRSNTRANSVVLDPQQNTMEPSDRGNSVQRGLQQAKVITQTQAPAQAHTSPQTLAHTRPANGSTAHHHHSRPADADMITSRLLQRSSSHNPPPQMSAIAATIVSDSHNKSVLSQSTNSTLVDTPGGDLVSRFMDGDGSAGTPRGGSSFMPSRSSPQSEGGDMNTVKRNKSMPDFADRDDQASTKSHPRRSGASTPSDLPPSRTQQKLMLQRASSNIEPNKSIPVILPRTGGPAFLHSGITYPSGANGEGRLDPRLQQQFNHVAVEYKVVRRYRNPLADAIVRIQQIPGMAKKTTATQNRRTQYKNTGATTNGNNSQSTSFSESASGLETSGTARSRPHSRSHSRRVSFDRHEGGGATRTRGAEEGDLEGRQSYGSADERVRNEAEEICRRLWDSTEMAEGD